MPHTLSLLLLPVPSPSLKSRTLYSDIHVYIDFFFISFFLFFFIFYSPRQDFSNASSIDMSACVPIRTKKFLFAWTLRRKNNKNLSKAHSLSVVYVRKLFF